VWKEKWQKKAAQGGGGGSDLGRSSDVCFRCGATGHWAAECRGAGEGEAAVSSPVGAEPNPHPPRPPLGCVGGGGRKTPLRAPSHRGSPRAETPAEVLEALQELGFSSFRPGQEAAVMRILSGGSAAPSPPSRGGRSAPRAAAPAAQVRRGAVHALLLSPEALVGGGGSGSCCLPPAAELPPVAFACIDEAHCVSQWSHNFRPSYLRLCKVLRDRLGVRCFLGLTATATPATARDVAAHLGVAEEEEGIAGRCAAVPPNLRLSVSMDRDRDQALISLLRGERFGHLDSIIVYCTRREETARVAALIRTCLQGVLGSRIKWIADAYHAGLSAAERRRVQRGFMSGRLRVVVATVAFGMGLDKADVRGVVHYNMPKNFESYVQEIGRAGRDGQPARCHLFLDPEGEDLHELRRHIYGDTVDFFTVKKLVQKVFSPCKCRELHQKGAPGCAPPPWGPHTPNSPRLPWLGGGGGKHPAFWPLSEPQRLGEGAGGWARGAPRAPPKGRALSGTSVPAGGRAGAGSGVLVEFAELSFHLRAYGDLSERELDSVCDFLHRRVVARERAALGQLRACFRAFKSVAFQSCGPHPEQAEEERSSRLRALLRDYFEKEAPGEPVEATRCAPPPSPHPQDGEDQVRADVRRFLAIRQDEKFSGRAVARIFHGIGSPCYPAQVYGRDRRFWRKHLRFDFHRLMRVATEEILALR
uniref:DNA 3'-5' helicase n=1 Tax=Anser cygnoides TaxID=8845 RepID=A0A8B9EK99_ANSCY